MKLSFRLKVRTLTLFFTIFKTQRMVGIVNKVENGGFCPFWDLENCTLNMAIKTLSEVQKEFHLDTIFVYSDNPTSFRALCYTVVSFHEYLHILLHTQYVDFGWFRVNVSREFAILRISDKKKREHQKVVAIIPNGKELEYPYFTNVEYDTGIDKKVILLAIGEKL